MSKSSSNDPKLSSQESNLQEANTTSQQSATDNPTDTTITDTSTKDTPTTDISLISGENKPRQYKKDNPSFFMMRSYQILLVLAMMAVFVLVMVYQTLFGHIQQPKKMVTVEQGDTYYGLLPDWQRQIPLFSMSIAKIYIKSQVTEPLHAGTYQLPENPTLIQAMRVLQQGSKTALVKVQIVEGKQAKDLYHNLRQIEGLNLELLGKNNDTEHNIDNHQLATALGIEGQLPEQVKQHADPIANHNIEGWFAPDTYYYGEGSSDKQILQDLYARQKSILEQAWANRDPNVPYQTPYEALIMASIIEKETGIADERPLISAVFANRINKGMRLQTDPTIIYGMGERYDGNIRRKDINEKTAYNTYQIDGLPPTPIALPSKDAIEATLHPAQSDALYFVATGNGGHKFSKTLAEHNQAVQEYLKVRRQQQNANKDSEQSDK